ncbi:hypothetical protein SUGI_0048510 [Cryptomeria japonica]|nr:hypothetical protein SUGI_0048510 [Cryptomeria japonica]
MLKHQAQVCHVSNHTCEVREQFNEPFSSPNQSILYFYMERVKIAEWRILSWEIRECPMTKMMLIHRNGLI